jgi:ubiquinone/menaquinone biosynthesis C-methylase UbiE
MFRGLAELGADPRVVADLGCGNGDWTVVLAARTERLFTCDFTASFLEHTRARIDRLPEHAEMTYAETDLKQVDLPAALDLVVAGAVFQYVDDADVPGILSKIRAALKPSGLLYLRATVAKQSERVERCSDSYQAIYRSIPWYHDTIATAGFKLLRHSTATDFVADEWSRRAFPSTWTLVGRPIGWTLKQIRRAYRSRRETDVLACLARPAW